MMTNIDVKIRNPYNNCILRKIIYHQYLPMLIGISIHWEPKLTVYGVGLPKPNFKPHECWPSKTHYCNSPYRLRIENASSLPQRLITLRVATVLTVHGIETFLLKLITISYHLNVATVLTVHGMRRRV